jgi:hypothetical protein
VHVLDLLDRFTLYVGSFPLWLRLATFVSVGLSLLALAVPRFQYEFPTALLYMLLAVLLFWMAIVAVM